MSSRFTFVPYADSGLVRLRVAPDEPAEGPEIIEQRPRGSRRAHTCMAVAKVRHLIERTDLTYSEIAKKTGVGRASICRWARDGKWLRPAHAPFATDLVPTLRAGRRLRIRMLATRLEALAPRHVHGAAAPPPLLQRAARRRVGPDARPGHPHRAERNAPRRRRPRPRAEGGGGT